MQATLDQEKAIHRVLTAIEAIRSGGMVIMTDDEDRENEGDLVLAADFVSPEAINFMAKEARGLICLTLEAEQVAKLGLPMMEGAIKSSSERGTAFTVSIEARHGVSTGISARDRALTIATAIKKDVKADDLVVPGHVFPLKARPGGVLQRPGHTEGSVDLARLAGATPAGVICEIMNDDGTMARLPDLTTFAEKHGLPIVTIADLVTFRLLKESLVELVCERPVLTSRGVFKSHVYRDLVDGIEHFALIKGENFDEAVVDVRVHQQRPLNDVFADPQQGGRYRIEHGLKMLDESDHAVLVYLTQKPGQPHFPAEVDEMATDKPGVTEPRKLRRAPMDTRQIGIGAQILRRLGVQKMRVHTTSNRPLKGVAGFGLEVVETQIIKLNH